MADPLQASLEEENLRLRRRVASLEVELEDVRGALSDARSRFDVQLEALAMVTANLEEAQARAHLGSWELHLDTLTGYWSAEMFRLMRRDPAEGIPNLDVFLDYVHPDDRPLVREVHEMAVRSPDDSSGYQLEYRLRADNPEEERLLRAEFHRRPGPPGRAPVLVGTTLDITDLSRAERAALEREESLRATFHSIGDAVIATDRRGHITRMNPVAERLTGWRVDEALGRPLQEVFQIFHARTGAPAEAPIKRVLETGEIVGLANDTVLVARDGQRYQIADSGAPIKDRTGQIGGVVLVFRDVTREYHLQEQLREHVQKRSEAHNFLVNILDALPVRVFWKNREGVYRGGNMRFARDAGLGHPGQITGKTEADMPWSTSAQTIAHLEDLVLNDEEAVIDLEEVRRMADEEERVLRCSRVPLRDLDGEVVGVLGIYEDITADKEARAEGERLEAQLRQAQKLETIGTLAGGIAHDFNNILTPILGYSDLGLASLAPNAPGWREFHEIHLAARRARDLVRQILAFSRQVDRALQPVSLAQIAGEVLTLLRPIVPAHIRFQTDIQTLVPPILADPSEIHQLLVNLCTNACQAMPQGGQLRIAIQQATIDHTVASRNIRLHPGAYVVLSVHDTGTGMDEATLARIFEPFFTTKPVNEGTGLGLSVAYGIVRNLGGVLTVDSTPGEGTTFSAYLPEHRAGMPAAAPEEEPAGKRPGGQETILVVDDEPAVCEVTSELLLRLGYHPVVSGHPDEALAYLAAHPREVDLVITDLTMPGMSGVALASRIYALYPGLPVLIMSGYGEVAPSQKDPTGAPRPTLAKPIVLDELAVSVRTILDAGSGSGNP